MKKVIVVLSIFALIPITFVHGMDEQNITKPLLLPEEHQEKKDEFDIHVLLKNRKTSDGYAYHSGEEICCCLAWICCFPCQINQYLKWKRKWQR